MHGVRRRKHVDQRRPIRFAHRPNKRTQRDGAQRKVSDLTAQQPLPRGGVGELKGDIALQRGNAGPLAAARHAWEKWTPKTGPVIKIELGGGT